MHNKKIVTRGLIFGVIISNLFIDSLANYNDEQNLLDMNNNLNPLNEDKINKNIIEGKVCDLILTGEGELVPDFLIGNARGYETIKVSTIGTKKLVQEDYNRLKLTGIPKIDLSDSYSDNIPGDAFSNATHLTEFKFPQGITSIGISAFQGCVNLTGDLIIPDTVTNIEASAFNNCTGLNGSLILPDSVTYIGSQAFLSCSGLIGELTIPKNVKSIGSRAFAFCKGLTGDLIIPDNVTSLDRWAFYECSGFDGELVIGSGIEYIKEDTFRGCSNLSGVLEIPNSVKVIEHGAFRGCKGFVGDLIIPDSVTNIGAYAFFDCSGFNGKLVLPSLLTSIESNTFSGCNNLTGDLVIPNSVTEIKDFAFTHCRNFTGELVLPNSLTSIGTQAFRGCNKLTGNLIIPNSVINIGEFAFYTCNEINGNLILSDSIVNIGKSAFAYCRKISGNIIIPNSIVSMGESVFEACDNVEKIIIKVDSSDADTNYKESIINNLPNTNQTIIDIPYDLNISETWMDSTNKLIGKPTIKNIVDGMESELVNSKGDTISLYIPSLYKESNMVILKDDKSFNIPVKDNEGKYIFTNPGVYKVILITDLGNTSIIDFEVEDPKIKEAEKAVEIAEISNSSTDLSYARDLVNVLPECLVKDQLQNRLNNIRPSFALESKIATSNLDLYIKSENMLLMNLSTNSITFNDYSGVDEVEQQNAVEISINSSLPYQLNTYLLDEMYNSDKTKKIDMDRLNIKDNEDTDYKEFTDINKKLVLKDNCEAGNDKIHIIDFKLKGENAYEADVYKTVIKFEVEQK